MLVIGLALLHGEVWYEKQSNKLSLFIVAALDQH